MASMTFCFEIMLILKVYFILHYNYLHIYLLRYFKIHSLTVNHTMLQMLNLCSVDTSCDWSSLLFLQLGKSICRMKINEGLQAGVFCKLHAQ